MKDKRSIYCEFCNVAITGTDTVAIRNGLPYHVYHTPDKTTKLQEEKAQTANTH